MHLRVISWNVAARRGVAAQAELLLSLAPDVVALQELTRGSWPAFRSLLAGAGLAHAADGGEPVITSRVRFASLVSRWPIRASPSPLATAAALVGGVVRSPAGPLAIFGLHVPTIANGLEGKLACQWAALEAVRCCHRRAVILAGDFNSPLAELADGTIVPFHGPRRLRERELELGLLGCGTAAHRLVDAFRAVNGPEADDRSWYWKNRGRTGGFRLDHIFASRALRPVACWYEHAARESGLSDHAPIVADFDL